MATTETDKLDGAVTGEVRLLIDGELHRGRVGQRFDNINPATEEVLGQVADASAADMDRAIAAARRAFDETDWSTEPRVPPALPRAAAGGDRERAGAAAGPSWWPRSAARSCSPTARSSTRRSKTVCSGRRSSSTASSGSASCPTVTRSGCDSWRKVREGAGRRGRGDRAVELPVRGHAPEARARPSPPATPMILKPAPDTPWNATRLGRLIAEQHRHPCRRVQRGHVVGPPRRRGAGRRSRASTSSRSPARPPSGRHIMEKGAPTMKRFFLELGGKSAHIVLDDADFAAKLLVGRRRLRPRRAGLRDAHPADGPAGSLRRVDRARGPAFANVPYGDPDRHGQHPGPADQRQAARAGARLHREGRGRRRPPRRRWRTAGAPRRASSSSRRCSPTSPTR